MRPQRAWCRLDSAIWTLSGDIPSVAVFQAERGISGASPRLSDSNRTLSTSAGASLRMSLSVREDAEPAGEIRSAAEDFGSEEILVPSKGLEPPHPCGYMDLNHARLPIPPRWPEYTPAASATSAEVGRMRRPQRRSRKELHFYSTDASTSVKRTGPPRS